MWLKKYTIALFLSVLVAGNMSCDAQEFVSYDPYSVDDEGLNIKEFNSGESFYLWTTFSIKVA